VKARTIGSGKYDWQLMSGKRQKTQSPGQVCYLVGRLRTAGRCINERRTGRGTLRRPGRQGEAVHDISSNRPGGSSIESLKKRLCLPQVGGIQPFGEPVINRLQHSLCASDTDMITQQPGEACGGTQFQGQRALPARPVERLPEMELGCGHCSGSACKSRSSPLPAPGDMGPRRNVCYHSHACRRPVCLQVGVLTALTASGIAPETNCGAALTRSELIAEIAAANPSLRDEDVATVVTTIFNEIASALARGDRVELRGFGAFTARRRAARLGRNPRNGEAVAVDEKITPFFRAGRALRLRMDTDQETTRHARPDAKDQEPVTNVTAGFSPDGRN
jgi:integration host factor subunit beta